MNLWTKKIHYVANFSTKSEDTLTTLYITSHPLVAQKPFEGKVYSYFKLLLTHSNFPLGFLTINEDTCAKTLLLTFPARSDKMQVFSLIKVPIGVQI